MRWTVPLKVAVMGNLYYVYLITRNEIKYKTIDRKKYLIGE